MYFYFREKIKLGISFNYAIRLYQEQIAVNRSINAYCSPFIIPTFVFGGGSLLVILLTHVLKHFRSPGPFWINCLAASFFLLFGYQFLIDYSGRVRKTSNQVKNLLWTNHMVEVRVDRKKRRLVLLACMEVRVYLGRILYFESATFLIFLKFILDEVIHILFVMREHKDT